MIEEARSDVQVFKAYMHKKYNYFIMTKIRNRFRSLLKFLLKFTLFSMIFQLEIFLQSSVILMLLGLAFWVLILIIFTSPLWIPLSICWAPAAIITFLVFRYTKVSLTIYLTFFQAGEKLIQGMESLFNYLVYNNED